MDSVTNPAVSVDLDETLLDNSAYEAGLIDSTKQFSGADFGQWILSENATAVPGAIAFVNYVNSQGGKVFFISDRAESSTGDTNNNDLEQATIENLDKLGFTGASDQTVLLSGEFTGTINGEVSKSKEFRRQAVEDGSADGTQHSLVVLAGDNLNDLDANAGVSDSDRRAYAEANKDRYNVYSSGEPAYIPLPNPQYGAWESGLYDPAAFGKTSSSQLTPEEKNIQRKQALEVWHPPATVPTPTTGGAQDKLNEQLVLPILWTQQSGEFAALSYGVYNTAKADFAQAVADGVTNPAVVVDLDETVLDNSAYEAWLVNTNSQFSNATWYEWIKSEQAKAVPGAVDFINYVDTNGGKVFFISDRDESSTGLSSNNDLEQATIDNLQKLGVTGADDQTVLLRGEFTAISDGKLDTSKQPRRQAVENGSADGEQHTIVTLVGDNLNDLDASAGLSDSDRRAYVMENSDRYGTYSPGQPAYIPIANPQYGAWEGPGLYDPAVFDKAQWFNLDPAEKNLQRKQGLTRWVVGSDKPFTGTPETASGDGGQKTFDFTRGDSLGLVTHFGGVGTGSKPTKATVAEADTLKFTGEGLTAKNLALTSEEKDLIVGFMGIPDTQVLLKNTTLEDIDNLPNAATNLDNLQFDGQLGAQDNFDVFDTASTRNQIWNRNSVTFLNDWDNVVTGFDGSDDVINGQGGNDRLTGLGGDDTLRGESGDDVLYGGAGNDTLTGGTGRDVFAIAAGKGADTMTDFNLSENDRIGLAGGLTVNQLLITQGTGSDSNNTLISVASSDELLATLLGVQANTITSAAFAAVV